MYGINNVRTAFIAVTGTVGAFIAELLGGWDSDVKTLVIFMIIDYIMGIIIAAFFKKSDKTDSGALSSKACWVGLCRKGITLLIVLVAHRLDLLIGTNYIRSAAVIGFCCSELVSIVENAGIMGVPLPSVIKKAIDILKTKEDNNDSNE
jgi:toxin secretion/phage lysis holin